LAKNLISLVGFTIIIQFNTIFYNFNFNLVVISGPPCS